MVSTVDFFILYHSFLYSVNLYLIAIADVRISLNIELENRLLLEISKYSPAIEETDASTLQIDKISLQEYDADIERNIIEQLSTLHNPFLMKAMEDYMPCELYKNDTVDSYTHNTRVPKTKQDQIYDLYKKYTYIYKKLFMNIYVRIIYTLIIIHLFSHAGYKR